ncbi:hypothetical protein [Selenomonas sp. F0473]|uniref:hypothetical protein n=1 Tax=Selenomonas sp. F0473 TaxID=999423 RepID=UPI002600EDDA|nr:hypothetical protein [Selenomonas sp. F0473]
MWYIFNEEGNCICTADHEPNKEDLATRSEIAIESNDVYALDEVILKDGVVQKKVME